jgi:hypothetical protein
MRRTFVRAAISVYPPGWRRRYGAELEQLVLDVSGGGGTSALEDARTVVTLAAAGVIEWLRRVGPKSRTAAFALAAGLAALLVNTVALSVGTQALAAGTWVTLPSNAVVGPGVRITYNPATRPGNNVLVLLTPGSSNIVSVTGAPTRVVLDPKTGKVLSIIKIRHPTRY